jgi:hypothetical protein
MVDGGGLSFAASTLVATPQGERPIATLKVGQQVSAYDPTTGKRTTQTIARVFLNHDSDRLDVTLALPASQAGAHDLAPHDQRPPSCRLSGAPPHIPSGRHCR